MRRNLELTDDQIRADIFHRLHRKKKWGGAHTAFQNLYKWCDHRYVKRYKIVTKGLIKGGFLISKPTSYGLQVSLNPNKMMEIKETIRRFF